MHNITRLWIHVAETYVLDCCSLDWTAAQLLQQASHTSAYFICLIDSALLPSVEIQKSLGCKSGLTLWKGFWFRVLMDWCLRTNSEVLSATKNMKEGYWISASKPASISFRIFKINLFYCGCPVKENSQTSQQQLGSLWILIQRPSTSVYWQSANASKVIRKWSPWPKSFG